LFDLSSYAYEKVVQWAGCEQEFVKRAAFSLLAGLAIHDKKSPDEVFERFFPLLIYHAIDDRNYVKKAVNWALRSIGKRNSHLNMATIKTAKEIRRLNVKSAQWIASDALRELASEKVQKKLEQKEKRKTIPS
jgi:3-methyladenine DNA glycosylase AlkD